MNQLIKMAYRNLGRNRRRSFFSALALGLGLALLLLMASTIEGELQQSLSSTIELNSGHLQVRANSYDSDKESLKWEDLVENPQAVADQISTLAPVVAATPRLFASGIVAARDQSVGINVIGIDPPSAANNPYRDGLVAGEFLDAADREGVLIGKALADQLDLEAGESINILVNTSDGDVDEQNFVIRGIYQTEISGYDRYHVFMPLGKAQAITRTENYASTIFIMLSDREQADAVMTAIQTDQYQFKTWLELNELLVQVDTLSGAFMWVLYVIVLAITATVIINTLVMAVYERTREIGILSSIGMKSKRIMALFFVESSMLGVGGIVFGLILGVAVTLAMSKVGFYIGAFEFESYEFLLGERIYPFLTLENTIVLTIVAFVVAILAGFYPALLAARMEPVGALRGGQ
jgi:ABC-type lipoprotein release transport system permease subunit